MPTKESAKRIVVDGVTYVPADLFGPIKIVVIERGFVYVGRLTMNEESEVEGRLTWTILGARSLICWGSSQHLGELVHGPLEETRLGAPCTVQVRDSQVVHMIEVDQDAWKQHVDG
jgi:hypothetical protein